VEANLITRQPGRIERQRARGLPKLELEINWGVSFVKKLGYLSYPCLECFRVSASLQNVEQNVHVMAGSTNTVRLEHIHQQEAFQHNQKWKGPWSGRYSWCCCNAYKAKSSSTFTHGFTCD
jgi:hypothetical protein